MTGADRVPAATAMFGEPSRKCDTLAGCRWHVRYSESTATHVFDAFASTPCSSMSAHPYSSEYPYSAECSYAVAFLVLSSASIWIARALAPCLPIAAATYYRCMLLPLNVTSRARVSHVRSPAHGLSASGRRWARRMHHPLQP